MILLVEDNDVQRETLARLLRGHGYSVRAVGTAEEAALEMASRRPDVIVVDLMLPGVTGTELIRWLGERPNGKPAVIVTTGLPEPLPDLPSDAVVLRKQFDVSQLVDVIEGLSPSGR